MGEVVSTIDYNNYQEQTKATEAISLASNLYLD
jgi:hypothetical protein